MQARRTSPDEIPEKYAERDYRDTFSVARRQRLVWELETYHDWAIEAGGPEALMEEGYPWREAMYGGRSGRELQEWDIEQIKGLVSMSAEDFELYAGDRGEGKSMLAYHHGCRLYAIGIKLISNLNPDIGYRLETAADLAAMVHAPKWCCFVLDEVHQIFSLFRQGTNFQREVVGAFAAMRKNRGSVLGITSQDGALGMDIKSQIKHVYYPRKGRADLDEAEVGEPWTRTYSFRIGPWPDLWRGKTLAEQMGLPVRRTKSRTVLAYPRPRDLWLKAPGLYNSFAPVPSLSAGGGNLRSEQLSNLGRFVLLESDGTTTHDGGAEGTTPAGGAGEGAPTVADLMRELYTDLLRVMADEDMPLTVATGRLEMALPNKWRTADVIRAILDRGFVTRRDGTLMRADLHRMLGMSQPPPEDTHPDDDIDDYLRREGLI